MMDPEVVRTIELALKSHPDDLVLRFFYAAMLFEYGRPIEALEQAKVLLGFQPEDLRTLRLASLAADHTNDSELGDRYRQLAKLVERDHFGNGLDGDEIDAFLADALGPQLESNRGFDSIIGLDEVKTAVRQSAAGFTSARRSTLFWGPPGCGKSLLARSMADEFGLALEIVSALDVLAGWKQRGPWWIQSLFERVQRQKGTLLLFEDVDTLVSDPHEQDDPLATHLAREIERNNNEVSGVVVVCTARTRWEIAPSLLEPACSMSSLLLLPLNEDEREQFLRKELRDVPQSQLEHQTMAQATELFSGEELVRTCHASRNLDFDEHSGSFGPTTAVAPLTTDKFLTAAHHVVPGVVRWASTARNHLMFTDHIPEHDRLRRFLTERIS